MSSFLKNLKKDIENAKDNFRDRRWWVFCWNNPTTLEIDTLLHDAEEVWWQLEEGHKRKVPHLQGVVRFKYPKGLGMLRKYVGCWWHIMRGTVEQATEYCTKEDTRIAGPWHKVFPHAEAYKMQLETILNPEEEQQRQHEVRRIETPIPS